MYFRIQVLLHAPISDVSKMVGKTKDPETLTMYISIMKKLVMYYNIFKTMCNILKKNYIIINIIIFTEN